MGSHFCGKEGHFEQLGARWRRAGLLSLPSPSGNLHKSVLY